MSSNSCSDFGYFKLRHFRLFFKLFMYLVAFWKYRTYPFIKFTKVDCLNSAIHTIKKIDSFLRYFLSASFAEPPVKSVDRIFNS